MLRHLPRLRRLVDGFPPRRLGFDPRSGHVGFLVDKVTLRQVFSEYFGFPCQFSFHRLLHTHHHHHHPRLVQEASSWPTYHTTPKSFPPVLPAKCKNSVQIALALIRKNLDGTGRGLIKRVSWDFPEGNDENHEEALSE
jgi:hypothetical protein